MTTGEQQMQTMHQATSFHHYCKLRWGTTVAAWLSENSHLNVSHFIQCFIQIKLSFIRNEADSCHHRRRLTNLQQNCHYEGTQAGHKTIFEAPSLCLKLYYTEINIWQNQRILHTDLTFTLGLAQRCTVTAEQSWGHKVIQAFVGSYLI